MSSLKKAMNSARKVHKERSQPAKRAKLGLLEKHKDYVQRARNYHKKEDRLRAMQEKASFKNPDEFYHKMINSSLKSGVHRDTKSGGTALPNDTVKIMKTQDKGYVMIKKTAEAKKVERAGSSLHFVGVMRPKQHVIFVDNEEEQRNFDAAKHFDTAPELVASFANRPRTSTLREHTLAGEATTKAGAKRHEKERSRAYTELTDRVGREKKLKEWMQTMEMQTQLMGKGKKKKVKDAEGGKPAVYKWDAVRQR